MISAEYRYYDRHFGCGYLGRAVLCERRAARLLLLALPRAW